MADSWAKIDVNEVPTLTAVTDDANQYITRLLVDPATGRLLVSGLSGGVSSLNTLIGDVVLAAGTNITLVPVGNTITINSTGGSSGITINTTTITGGTTGQLLYDNAGTVGELTTATYPSLTELSYVKGVTSSIQTQLNGKQATLTNPVTGTGTTNEISYWTAAGTQGTLAVATYPSLTELSYVKGATSAIQTQITAKADKNGGNWTFASQAIGDIAYATSTTAYGRLAAPAAGKILASGGAGAAPVYSVPTFPTSASATTRNIIVSDGTNWTASTETYAVPGTSGNVLTSDGTNWTSAAPVVSASSTTTFTNKRINPRLVTAASYTTDTGTSLDVSTCDQFEITAQAGALLFNAPSGTPVGGQKLIIRIKDNGTARALTYNAIFRAMGNALPSTTVLSKTLYMGFIYNATDTKWDLVAIAQES